MLRKKNLIRNTEEKQSEMLGMTNTKSTLKGFTVRMDCGL